MRRLQDRQRHWRLGPAPFAGNWESGWPSVVALLFTPPDSDAISTLDVRGEYFDVRTGEYWDLFFPGYYRSSKTELEHNVGARPVGRRYMSDWYFGPHDFDYFCREVESASAGRWQYSGEADLVLINAWLPPRGVVAIDWESTISGQLTNRASGTQTLTLGNVIERITRDLKSSTEDTSYGVGEVTNKIVPSSRNIGRDFMVQALSGIAAALGAKALGG
jgi:hypothetical protein